MSHPNPAPQPDAVEAANTELLPAEQQAVVDAAHATTGWNAYDVWQKRVFVPQQTGYNKKRGNT